MDMREVILFCRFNPRLSLLNSNKLVPWQPTHQNPLDIVCKWTRLTCVLRKSVSLYSPKASITLLTVQKHSHAPFKSASLCQRLSIYSMKLMCFFDDFVFIQTHFHYTVLFSVILWSRLHCYIKLSHIIQYFEMEIWTKKTIFLNMYLLITFSYLSSALRSNVTAGIITPWLWNLTLFFHRILRRSSDSHAFSGSACSVRRLAFSLLCLW